jgi:hypothetical protein
METLSGTCREADEGSWTAETSVENREVSNPLLISLEEIPEGEGDSDDWPVPLEIWIDSWCY